MFGEDVQSVVSHCSSWKGLRISAVLYWDWAGVKKRAEVYEISTDAEAAV